jgi:hypothetical protein
MLIMFIWLEKDLPIKEVLTVISPAPGKPSGVVGVGAGAEDSGGVRMMSYFSKFRCIFLDTVSEFTIPERKKALGPRYLGYGKDSWLGEVLVVVGMGEGMGRRTT